MCGSRTRVGTAFASVARTRGSSASPTAPTSTSCTRKPRNRQTRPWCSAPSSTAGTSLRWSLPRACSVCSSIRRRAVRWARTPSRLSCARRRRDRMLAKRVIPCLDVKDGRVVKGTRFVELRDAGDPVGLAERYDREGADELVFLDITASHERRRTIIELAAAVAELLTIPFCVGGGIDSVEVATNVLRAGADKVAVNSAAVRRPALLGEIAARAGS